MRRSSSSSSNRWRTVSSEFTPMASTISSTSATLAPLSKLRNRSQTPICWSDAATMKLRTSIRVKLL
ncbi:hypothetical protein CsSME_00027693 [Camellia sinensis var. sinensis]